MNDLKNAISLYDSLYTIKKGSEAGYRLAGIKFSILNDLKAASEIYNECIKYCKNKDLRFKSSIQNINLLIASGNIDSADKLVKEYIKEYNSENQSYLLKIKEIQINFYLGEKSLMDDISTLLLNTNKDDEFYNDLLELQSLLISFKDDEKLLKEFSEVQLMIFQNKINIAIDELSNMLPNQIENKIINDLLILNLSYLLILRDNPDNAIETIDSISH